MPITTKGRDVQLTRNPGTGLYDLTKGADGNPTLTDSEEHAVLTQLIEEKESAGHPGWFTELTDGQPHGSLLYTMAMDTSSTPSQMENYALDALDRLVEEGRILPEPSLSANARRVAAGRTDLTINYATPDGKKQETRLVLKVT